MHTLIQQVTNRIMARSAKQRALYLQHLEKARLKAPQRSVLHCGNLAHGFAACAQQDKMTLRHLKQANIAIISAYNDLLSAHQPYAKYPTLIKEAIREVGSVAQFAGGVPAMCDGITQGQIGMELSLMSRDVIAMSAAIALSHNMFDGGLMLGICDKIVPGLLIAALNFGHLPFVFIPAGPMPSGIANREKVRIRQEYAKGAIDKEALLEIEAASYHSPGTCTFYGTANSNQLLMEIMGLHLPGASFVHPNCPLREALTKAAAKQVTYLTDLGDNYLPIGRLFDVKNLVNGMVGLLATGGSTNHTMHLVAIARAAGFLITWDDFSDLSKVTPLITRIYPNGEADINQFQQAGGMAYLIHTLLEAELLYEEVNTVFGFGLAHYTKQPQLQESKLIWVDGPRESTDLSVLTTATRPFMPEGGLQVLSGNLGRAIIKTSALTTNITDFTAPAVVFSNQQALEQAFKRGELDKDCIVVVPFQGPIACGMPELHQLTTPLGVLSERGFRVALITDGRMSGASGKIPAAIHLTPEAIDGGLIAKVKTGDMIHFDIKQGKLEWLVSEKELAKRHLEIPDISENNIGLGRNLFLNIRRQLSGAEQGASCLFATEDNDDA